MVSREQTALTAPVVLFDGACGFCDLWVQFVLRHDRSKILRFAPLQSEAGATLLTDRGLPSAFTESIVLVVNGRFYRDSTAVLQILRRLGGPWFLTAAALAVPRRLRDALYRLVATNRYAWFGRLESCRLPSEEERSRFLSPTANSDQSVTPTGSPTSTEASLR